MAGWSQRKLTVSCAPEEKTRCHTRGQWALGTLMERWRAGHYVCEPWMGVRTVYDIQDARREAGLLCELSETDGGERYALRWLEHVRVPADHRHREHP